MFEKNVRQVQLIQGLKLFRMFRGTIDDSTRIQLFDLWLGEIWILRWKTGASAYDGLEKTNDHIWSMNAVHFTRLLMFYLVNVTNTYFYTFFSAYTRRHYCVLVPRVVKEMRRLSRIFAAMTQLDWCQEIVALPRRRRCPNVDLTICFATIFHYKFYRFYGTTVVQFV